MLAAIKRSAAEIILFLVALCTLRGAIEVVTFLSVTKYFFVRGPIDTPYLQAGLTDLHEIWHDARS